MVEETIVHFEWADVQQLIQANPLFKAELNNIRLKREVNHAINAVREIERNGEKYKATERTRLVGVVGAFGGHPSGCTVCANDNGTAEPDPAV